MHSQVYRCFKLTDLDQKHPFAVKVTREEEEEKLLSIRNEFTLTRTLEHSNLVQSFELFENAITKEFH